MLKIKNITASDITTDLNDYVLAVDEEVLIEEFDPVLVARSTILISKIAVGDIRVYRGTIIMTPSDGIRALMSRPHVNPLSSDGKEIIRSDSRPTGTETYFTMRGDDENAIGEGKEIYWDFSNSNDIISGAPTGYKRKRLLITFVDPIYIKEGTFYFFDAIKKSWFDMYIVCPSGHYYLDHAGSPHVASQDVPIIRYVNHHLFAGSVPMGDESNTEGCQEVPLPPNYVLWFDITVPESDTVSYGWAELETYRRRSVLLPGESI